MLTTVTVIVVILVVLVAIVLATRKKPELPTGEDSSARELPPRAATPSQRSEIDPTRPSAVTKSERKGPADAPKPAETKDEPATAAPVAESAPAPAAERASSKPPAVEPAAPAAAGPGKPSTPPAPPASCARAGHPPARLGR
jgi:hypothetical protein